MTPLANTLYSITLFLALTTLRLWIARRHRVVPINRAGVAQALDIHGSVGGLQAFQDKPR